MHNNKTLLMGAITIAMCHSVAAQPDIYGKMNLTLHNKDNGSASIVELRNNYSRLGFRGSESLDGNMEIIYQYELGINPDDDTTFTSRNSFLGIKAPWGTLKAGIFDTAFKSSQGKIDLFNDLVGDIGRVISPNENRASNNISYNTPKFAGGLVATVQYIAQEDEEIDDGVSTSVTYNENNLHLGAAYDKDVEIVGFSAARITASYLAGNLRMGGLYENVETDGDDATKSGWLISGLCNIEKWDLKVQHGSSDIVFDGGTSTSLGFNYKATKSFSYTTYLTLNESDDGLDDTYLGAGGILKF